MSEAAEHIQKRMEALRCDLAEDVDEVARSSGQVVDWREYVRRYPWACLGVAAALGFFVVPRRLETLRPDADTLVELAKRNKLVVKPSPAPHKRETALRTLFAFAGSAALRGAVSFLGQQMGRVASGQDSGSGHGAHRRRLDGRMREGR